MVNGATSKLEPRIESSFENNVWLHVGGLLAGFEDEEEAVEVEPCVGWRCLLVLVWSSAVDGWSMPVEGGVAVLFSFRRVGVVLKA